MNRATIRGCGMYVPERVVTNQDLEEMVDTSDEWITSRTGIKERHVVAPDESTSSMAITASQRALDDAGLETKDIDLVIVGTATPDYQFPATACLVQDSLGIEGGAFDLEAGCTSFVYALSIASAYVSSGMYRNVLVVGSESLSRILDWTDRSTCVLFGDGAGAVVVSAGPYSTFDPQFVLGSDGSGGKALCLPAGGSAMPASTETIGDRLHFIRMAGPEVFRFATRVVGDATRQVLDKAGLEIEDIDIFIPHQANTRIIDSAVRRVGIPEDRVFINIDRYGNTSSASIPIALYEARQQGKLKRGDTVVMVGFGAGLTWAAGAIQWGTHVELQRQEVPVQIEVVGVPV
ncbi:MAG TPA: beta-ketoacyl-ACP synthase III [Chloroflexota bacterium]|nr:beta-ketoacyl-ACP synthase III [Chloroflexota bacterium]